MNETPGASLRPIENPEYSGPSRSHEIYWEVLLQQYKIYAETVESVSNRRNQIHTLFLTLNTGAVGTLALAGTNTPALEWMLLPLCALMLLCFTWWRILWSIRQLNRGKFVVIGEFEALLPARPWEREWIALGEGKDPRKFVPLTYSESFVPLVFAAGYAIVFVGTAGVALDLDQWMLAWAERLG